MQSFLVQPHGLENRHRVPIERNCGRSRRRAENNELMLLSDLISVKGRRRLLQLLLSWLGGGGLLCLDPPLKGTLLTMHAPARGGVGGVGCRTVGSNLWVVEPGRRSLHVKCIKQQTIQTHPPPHIIGCFKQTAR